MRLLPVIALLCLILPVGIFATNTTAPGYDSSLLTDTRVNIDYLLGHFSPKKHPDFSLVPEEFRDQREHYLRKEVTEAFVRMAKAAKKEKIYLFICSGTRPFGHQEYIWSSKFNGKRKVSGQNLATTYPDDPLARCQKILQLSAAPGTSRHHWGTDIDINEVDDDYFQFPEGAAIYKWLTTNAAKFGFYQVYTAGRDHGYQREVWHWSYAPSSRPLLERYNKLISYKLIRGFPGAKFGPKLRLIEDYVNGINPVLK